MQLFLNRILNKNIVKKHLTNKKKQCIITYKQKKGVKMRNQLKRGHVGMKETYVAKEWLKDEIKKGANNKIYLEEFNNHVFGQFFNNFEELLDENRNIKKYKNFKEYFEDATDGLDEEEKSEYYAGKEIEEYFINLKKDEFLYKIDSDDDEFGTNKNDLILNSIADGQGQTVFRDYKQALDSYDNPLFDDEILTIFIYEYIGNDRDKYIENYKKLQRNS